jgi:hypothetical protein
MLKDDNQMPAHFKDFLILDSYDSEIEIGHTGNNSGEVLSVSQKNPLRKSSSDVMSTDGYDSKIEIGHTGNNSGEVLSVSQKNPLRKSSSDVMSTTTPFR